MSKAAELAALIGSQTALSNRNLIINGAMNVAQRSTSTTDTTGYSTLDRFKLHLDGFDEAAVTLSLIHISEPTRPERIGCCGVWV